MNGDAMLTRLRISGFKNLVDVDVRFGPFTCIAGSNGVGKSNLLDVIAFLSALAEQPLSEAAMGVRNGNQRRGDIGNIFHRYGDHQARKMSLEAEMVIPKFGQDDLGQEAQATTTFVRYALELRLLDRDLKRNLPTRIEIEREELSYIKAGEVKRALGFRASPVWIKSAVSGIRYTSFYISTAGEGEQKMIAIHQDGGGGGRVRKLLAKSLPRTALSSANAVENRTATLVKNEMLSWRRVQLEPSAMRAPDSLSAPTIMGPDGSHLPSMLCELARQPIYKSLNDKDQQGEVQDSRVFAMAANRLADLIDDVRQVRIDKNERLDQLTLQVAGRDGTFHPAQSLSDGTLRFLALAALELDPRFQGVIFMEEPENGIHPARIPAILQLLQDIAVDVQEPIGPGNPLRQVIINTHSPAVVAQIPENSLLIADVRRANPSKEGSYGKVFFSAPEGSWRAIAGSPVFPKGNLLPYLAPVPLEVESSWDNRSETLSEDFSRRVIDNPSYQLMLFRDTAA
jgi:predicted ATPase